MTEDEEDLSLSLPLCLPDCQYGDPQKESHSAECELNRTAARVHALETELEQAVTERAKALAEAAAMLRSWAEFDAAHGDATIADALLTAAICVLALEDPAARVPCGCDGCAARVEAYSRSRMCYPCANEDCEHGEADELDSPLPGGDDT